MHPEGTRCDRGLSPRIGRTRTGARAWPAVYWTALGRRGHGGGRRRASARIAGLLLRFARSIHLRAGFFLEAVCLTRFGGRIRSNDVRRRPECAPRRI